MKKHPDGRATGDGFGVRAEDVRERGPVRARGLRVDNVLRVFEANPEKDLAIPGLEATNSPRAGEGVDFQLKDSGGESRLHTQQHQDKRQKEARHVGSDRVSRARSSGGPDTGEEFKMRKIQTGPKGKRTARQVKKLKTQKDALG